MNDMISPDNALPGRNTPICIPEKHFITKNPIAPPFPEHLEQALFAMGCFWGAEKKFWELAGIYCTAAGYTAGYTGALSKTMDKSFVSPFLFDIKRSEVDGPILQFQSTIFSRDDMLKLVKTLNKACGEDQLTDERLDKAFGVWWPTLEEELNKLKGIKEESSDTGTEDVSVENSEILEEILDLSRINQKLLRNPDNELSNTIMEMNERLQVVLSRLEKERYVRPRKRRRFHPGMIEELMHSSPKLGGKYIAFQMVVSLFREDFPWLYESGMDVVRTLKSTNSMKEKDRAVSEFMELVEFSFEHPIMREMVMPDKEQYMMLREFPYMLRHSLKMEE